MTFDERMAYAHAAKDDYDRELCRLFGYVGGFVSLRESADASDIQRLRDAHGRCNEKRVAYNEAIRNLRPRGETA